MSGSSKVMGTRYERKLVQYFGSIGFGAVRVTGSGAGGGMPKPDIVVNSPEFQRPYAVELKSTNNDVVYIRGEQVEGLKSFCRRFGAVPLVCVKFHRMNFAFFKLADLYPTDNGYRVTRRNAMFKLDTGFDFV